MPCSRRRRSTTSTLIIPLFPRLTTCRCYLTSIAFRPRRLPPQLTLHHLSSNGQAHLGLNIKDGNTQTHICIIVLEKKLLRHTKIIIRLQEILDQLHPFMRRRYLIVILLKVMC
ncbi:hypothetical protein B296_00056663, partial [Ensete ventricosum]